MAYYRAHILVCTGTGCAAANANGLAEEFEAQLKKFGLDQEIRVVKTGCLGVRAKGPNVVIYPDGTHYIMVHVEDVAEIVEEHLLKGRPVQAAAQRRGWFQSGGGIPHRHQFLSSAAANCPAELRRH